MKACQKCRNEIKVDKEIGRKDACPFCQSDLRCCLNCYHHDLNAYNQCRETQADRVLDKDRSNFCDYFNFRDRSPGSQKIEGTGSIKKKLDDLFKN
jgi:hypothetical protein